MKIQKFLIAGGNATVLVWDCPSYEKNTVIKRFLGKFEQVGFIDTSNKKIPKLSMMGNELCINATFALASTLSKKGVLKTSGYKEVVEYKNTSNRTTMEIRLPYRIIDNCVLLPGIGFVFSEKPVRKLILLKELANRYQLPAFGVIEITKNQIKPTIFVKETNSIIEETACGSGSIATNIMFGIEKVQQPSLEYIIVRRNGDAFTVEARVDKINI